MLEVKNDRCSVLERRLSEVTARSAKGAKLDRRKRARRAPANHPWRQYNVTSCRKED